MDIKYGDETFLNVRTEEYSHPSSRGEYHKLYAHDTSLFKRKTVEQCQLFRDVMFTVINNEH